MSGIGSANLRKYRDGGRLTRAQAIAAMCSWCLCDYTDGRQDCEMPHCPLHPWMPYGKAGETDPDDGGGDD